MSPQLFEASVAGLERILRLAEPTSCWTVPTSSYHPGPRTASPCGRRAGATPTWCKRAGAARPRRRDADLRAWTCAGSGGIRRRGVASRDHLPAQVTIGDGALTVGQTNQWRCLRMWRRISPRGLLLASCDALYRPGRDAFAAGGVWRPPSSPGHRARRAARRIGVKSAAETGAGRRACMSLGRRSQHGAGLRPEGTLLGR